MGIVVNCDCGWSAVVPDRFDGKHIRCHKCREAVAVGLDDPPEPVDDPRPGPRRLVLRSIAALVGLVLLILGTAEGLSLAFGRPSPTRSLIEARQSPPDESRDTTEVASRAAQGLGPYIETPR